MPGLEDILSFIGTGNLLGLPPALFMAMPFLAGLIAGSLIKKAIKLALLGVVIIGGLLYVGVLNMVGLKTYFENLGVVAPEVMHYAALVLGMLPLGLGFAVGVLIGLKYG